MKMTPFFLSLLVLISFSSELRAESKSAKELYSDLAPEKKAQLAKEMQAKNITESDLEEIEVNVDPQTKNIDISGNNEKAQKHALFLALRLGFPLLAGIGIVYRNEGAIPFNVTLNAQTIILASSYNASIAWNFYKGFFVGPTLHLIRTNNVWGGVNENRWFYGAQVGYQHAFGETKRWYIDGRLEVIKAEEGIVPNANIGFGVRFW